MNREQLLERISTRWDEFNRSYSGLLSVRICESGVVGDWSIKDLVAHVTTWEEETLKAVPMLVKGQRPPRYGGVDRFNALQAGHKASLTLDEVLRQRDEVHQKLVVYVSTIPEKYLVRETPVRKRLRLDTYGHYPEHTRSILAWRRARNI